MIKDPIKIFRSDDFRFEIIQRVFSGIGENFSVTLFAFQLLIARFQTKRYACMKSHGFHGYRAPAKIAVMTSE